MNQKTLERIANEIGSENGLKVRLVAAYQPQLVPNPRIWHIKYWLDDGGVFEIQVEAESSFGPDVLRSSIQQALRQQIQPD